MLKKILIFIDLEFELLEGFFRGNGGLGESVGYWIGGCYVLKVKGRLGNVVCEDEGG